jgi:uncharacterized protein YndB with AHSA1/START domain
MFIKAPCGLVFKAFFDPHALGAWWQVVRSVTTPRVLGPYAIEWTPTEFHDEILGRLGGTFRGTVMQVEPGASFFVGDAYWLPPDGDPIGPMGLDVALTDGPTSDGGPGTTIRVIQTGYEESARWRRYYDVVTVGWERALSSLKMLLEK